MRHYELLSDDKQNIPPDMAAEAQPQPTVTTPKRRQHGGWVQRSQIISMIIPSSMTSSGLRQNNSGLNEYTSLLTPLDHPATSPVPSDTNSFVVQNTRFEIRHLFSGPSFIPQLTSAVNQPSTFPDGSLRKIVAIATDSDNLFVGIEELPYLFLVNPNVESTTSDVKFAYHQLTLPGLGQLVPVELSVNPRSKVIYMVGKVLNQTRLWLLVKLSFFGSLLARSRPYQYQRYSGLMFDPVDGELLLACPKIDQSNECDVGQICKLTSNFKRRIFSITVGSDKAAYRPDFVVASSAGSCCWASVERGSRSPTEHQPSTRRLFSFPGCQPDGSETSPRNWLRVTSWDFADLTPGRISAYDADRLLVVDNNTGALAYITWPKENDKPTLNRITRSGSARVDLMCSNYCGKETKKSLTYLVADSSVYAFKFCDGDA